MVGRFRRLEGQHRAVLFGFVLLALAGLWRGIQLPAAILPEITFPRITLLADSGERDTDEMLRGVTLPLEQSLRRVPGLRSMRTTTSRGSVEMNLDFDWGTDMDLGLQRVQALANGIRDRLPAGTALDARLMSPALFPVLGLSLTSATRSPIELRDLAELQLKPELARLPGVAEVVLQGGRRPEVRVTLDAVALQSRSLTVEDVATAVSHATELGSLGLHSANRELYLALVDDRPRDLASLARLSVPVAAGGSVPLGTLGRIELAEAPEFTRYASGGGQAVLVNVLRQTAASTVTLSDGVRGWLAAHRSLLPADVRVGVFYDQSDLVRGALHSVRDGLFVGALLAILIVAAFLGSARMGLIGAVMLPGTIALTLLALSLAGQSLNLMTLGGIAASIGLVLDDAIVVLEHLAHETALGRDRAAALAELFPTLLASSLCSLAIFVPFALLGGVAGAFFKVLAGSVATMLAVSLALAVGLLPHLASRASGAAHPPLGDLGAATLHRLLPRRIPLLAAALVLVSIGALLGRGVGSGFLPSMDEGSLILDYFTPPGTSLEETERILRQLERELATTPEIVSWSRRTGDQLGFFITEPNVGDYVLRLDARRHRTSDQVADDLRDRIGSHVAGVDIEFGQLVEDVIGDLTTTPEPIELRVYGEDRALARATAQQAADLLGRVPGVVDVRDGVVVSGPNLLLEPTDRAHRLGIDADALERLGSPLVRGQDAGQIPRGARTWPVRLVLAPASGDRLPALLDSQVPLPGGGAAPLGELAHASVLPGDVEIARHDQRSMVSVTARLAGRDMGSAMRDVQRRMRDSLAVAPGLHVEYAGQYAEQQSSFRGLGLVLALAACGVLFLLLVAFRSWSQALAVMVTAIASLSGVFIALRIAGETLNLSSFVGAIMVVGIVAENAVFVIAAYRGFLAEGRGRAEASLLAAQRRLRPILMTTLAGVAALLPLLLGWGQGTALLRPLALAVAGGFSVSALLLLFVLPSLLAGWRPARA